MMLGTVLALPPMYVADTAVSLTANGANCSSGQAPLGVDASGAVEGCTVYVTPTYTGDVTINGKISGQINAQSIGTVGLTAAQVSNGLINNYNASPATATYTLPAAVAGYNVMFVCGSAAQIYIDPNASEIIHLDGVALTGGYRVASAATCTVGDAMSCFTFQTGASTWRWSCGSIVGVWANAGS